MSRGTLITVIAGFVIGGTLGASGLPFTTWPYWIIVGCIAVIMLAPLLD